MTPVMVCEIGKRWRCVCLPVEAQEAEAPATRLESAPEILEQCRLATTVRSHDRAAPAERVEAGEKGGPCDMVHPISLAEHAVNGERVIAGAAHRSYWRVQTAAGLEV